jgi:hypothetical protein
MGLGFPTTNRGLKCVDGLVTGIRVAVDQWRIKLVPRGHSWTALCEAIPGTRDLACSGQHGGYSCDT